MEKLKRAIKSLSSTLKKSGIETRYEHPYLLFTKGPNRFELRIEDGTEVQKSRQTLVVNAGTVIYSGSKLVFMIFSKLKLNRRIYARQCEIRKVQKDTAREFLEKFHTMGSTESGSNYGLYHQGELVCLAAFSKGRKMNRLPAGQRSFELIRFCSAGGITVAGGLTRLLQHFIREKNAGDIMTYVDREFSDGAAFLKAGFEHAGNSVPVYFLTDRRTYEITAALRFKPSFDVEKQFLTVNQGNFKFVYTPG